MGSPDAMDVDNGGHQGRDTTQHRRHRRRRGEVPASDACPDELVGGHRPTPSLTCWPTSTVTATSRPTLVRRQLSVPAGATAASCSRRSLRRARAPRARTATGDRRRIRPATPRAVIGRGNRRATLRACQQRLDTAPDAVSLPKRSNRATGQVYRRPHRLPIGPDGKDSPPKRDQIQATARLLPCALPMAGGQVRATVA
jgi:hypothetical protein